MATYKAGDETTLLRFDLDYGRCFLSHIDGSNTSIIVIGETLTKRLEFLKRRKVKEWTVRKTGRACIFHQDKRAVTAETGEENYPD